MKALTWMLVVLLLVGCATPKNIDHAAQIDYSESIRQMRSRMDSLLANMQLMRKETSDKLSNLKIDNTTTFLSPPDSTGKQYPTVISETKANKEEKESTSVDTEITITIQRLVKEVSKLREELDAIVNEEEKVIGVSWWQLHKIDVYTGLVAVIIVIYLIYKKKK